MLLSALFEKLLQMRQQGRQPVLVIDDAHWLDSEGLDAVASVLRFEAEKSGSLADPLGRSPCAQCEAGESSRL